MEHNYVNEFQEYIQALAPGLGARLETMYRFVECSYHHGFSCRIELLNVASNYEGPRLMGESRIFASKKSARQNAARLALLELQKGRLHPHDPHAQPLVVAEKEKNNNNHQSMTEELPDFVLPPLSTALLDVEAVVVQGKVAMKEKPEKEEYLFEKRDDELSNITRVFTIADISDVHASTQICTDIPGNLGRLGEEYVLHWLQVQPWIVSVVWLNEEEDQGTHDIECCVTGDPGRSFVEVKTHWNKARASASQVCDFSVFVRFLPLIFFVSESMS